MPEPGWSSLSTTPVRRGLDGLDHPVVRLGHPVVRLGHPVVRLGHPVVRLGHPVNGVSP